MIIKLSQEEIDNILMNYVESIIKNLDIVACGIHGNADNEEVIFECQLTEKVD